MRVCGRRLLLWLSISPEALVQWWLLSRALRGDRVPTAGSKVHSAQEIVYDLLVLVFDALPWGQLTLY
jgi:hypothetical protein